VDALVDDQVDNTAFLEELKELATKNMEAGISWRWSLSAKPDGQGVDLTLQVILVITL